jgi:hypothetical protein
MVNNHFVRISKETKALIPEVRAEFFRNNPRVKGLRVTEGFLTLRAYLYYLGRGEKL